MITQYVVALFGHQYGALPAGLALQRRAKSKSDSAQ
jgi:hypothetical protein